MTLNWETVHKIKQGHYSFVYLSPEVFLNSSLFTELFFSKEFQDMLALIVVDEGHMIYLWGLVASKQSKGLIIFARLEDQAIFRPAYGHIGTWLMATNNIPILLLSATCRPEAVDKITTSLMLSPSDLHMINGELTRPEIRFIRVYMDSTLSSCDDLLRLFAPHTKTAAEDSVPMIIYSGTRNRTFQVMKVVNEARHTQKHEYDPNDQFIRRYHSVTGDEDKARTVEDFGNAQVPVISATMALGLGQNLKRVRCVVHMGRGDPAAIVQMVGRCGRDGNVGLGLLFMERTRKNGKNDVESFGDKVHQEDDARMDALAVTPCCLRIALALDNKVGYIPLSEVDPNFLAERLREEKEGFAKCRCSNCAPEEAARLLEVFQLMSVQTFDAILEDPFTHELDPSIVTMKHIRKKPLLKGSCPYPQHLSDDLVRHLVHGFEGFYLVVLGAIPEFSASVFFGTSQAQAIADSIDEIRAEGKVDLRLLELVIGAALDQFIEDEGLRVRAAMAQELDQLKGQAEARRLAEKTAKAQALLAAKRLLAEERAAERMRVAEDRRQEKALIAEERAAELQWVRKQAKDTRALDKQRRAILLQEGRLPVEDQASGNNGAEASGTDISQGLDSVGTNKRFKPREGQAEELACRQFDRIMAQQRKVEEQARQRDEASQVLLTDLKEKQEQRASRRAEADTLRENNEACKAAAKRRRLDTIKGSNRGDNG
ncbi:uncharacterized protein PGTG_11175 [Puccinia graminis f. sp. tritici CRL 75-36-700-3]|uniref:DNA 3'-5' helicase n=1 Tax=Puccinia graminis f. sp. tritici (strain CRL 75-36-700-3 / race SCCL) TaxID=418459 RepID=E3KL31_PUCGT|nr:uncharacterized protein PGTG_11175 [Puccinia graminis f. sp. tritici CRL 75-36-700-3]EFP85006.2 hypothetical protein PGTG_11175 [Puccinia graminis f. sp. tritici CRL 75-36-700-3]